MSRETRAGAYQIEGVHLALHAARKGAERICLSCGIRIGRMSTIEYAAVGGLCQACDGGQQ